jgi:hypothetical protein
MPAPTGNPAPPPVAPTTTTNISTNGAAK